jgi:hypothetical protein
MWATLSDSVDATTSRSMVKRARTCSAIRWRTGGSRVGCRRQSLWAAPVATAESTRGDRIGSWGGLEVLAQAAPSGCNTPCYRNLKQVT